MADITTAELETLLEANRWTPKYKLFLHYPIEHIHELAIAQLAWIYLQRDYKWSDGTLIGDRTDFTLGYWSLLLGDDLGKTAKLRRDNPIPAYTIHDRPDTKNPHTSLEQYADAIRWACDAFIKETLAIAHDEAML